MSQDTYFNIVALSIVGIIVIANLVTFGIHLVKKGVRALMVILVIVITFVYSPKVSTFLVNKIGDYGIVQNVVSYLVERDVEERVVRRYQIETGEDLTQNPTLLEELKTTAFTYDPNVRDEINIIQNAGLPRALTNVIVLNMKDTGQAKIQADNFYDYAARFLVSRAIMFFSYIAVFFLADKLLLGAYDRRFEYHYLK